MAKLLLKETEEWFARNRQDLIHCPHQPGNLVITRYGCTKRRIKARQENLDQITKCDIYEYLHRTGLILCRDCRVGLSRPVKVDKPMILGRPGRNAGAAAAGSVS